MVMRRASGFVWHTRAIKKRSVSHRVFEVAYIYIDPNGWEISKKNADGSRIDCARSNPWGKTILEELSPR